jgi:hypothetical protein
MLKNKVRRLLSRTRRFELLLLSDMELQPHFGQIEQRNLVDVSNYEAIDQSRFLAPNVRNYMTLIFVFILYRWVSTQTSIS